MFEGYDWSTFDANDYSTYPQPNPIEEIDAREYSTDGLAGMPIYIFSGENDTTAVPEWQFAQYEWFMSKSAEVKMESISAGHTLPNDLPDNPYIAKKKDCLEDGYTNCGYDLTGKALEYIYGQ